ncbi:tetratricopeptide repeat protein [Nibrella saemangeumensis]|uniref:Tetratricopeptide repeat protein n=1 Tax=Nibrella saemangeumensis TaxID=1084526 RepID=A0ABP8MLF3_9BACT
MQLSSLIQLRRTFLIAGTLIAPFTVSAQRTLSYTEPDYHYRTGVELFEKDNYAAARYEFQQFLDRRKNVLNTNDQNTVSAEYYIALTSLYIDEPGAEVMVDRFVKNHSEHPRAGQLYADLGNYYFNKEDYGRAISFLEKAVQQNNNYTQQAENKFKLAMAYYNTQNLPKALPLLNTIKQDSQLSVAPAASYYAGVINFRQNNFREAVSDFRRVEKNPTYQNEVPGWIAQALYKEQRFDELLAYTEPLLRRGGAGALPEVALFTAEVFYQQGNYAKAIPYYRQYLSAKNVRVPAAVRFRYGQSLFKTGAYPDAIAQLKQVSSGKDTTAQYAAYTLGISYLQTQNPQYALTSFDQASRLPFNPAIQEEAAFNHAKLQLDLNNGGDAAKLLTEFLRRYPNSKFENEANELISEAYFASNNYPAAISYIEGLKRRTPKINATYQRLTFNQAVNDFNAERYAQAIQNFDKSLQNPTDAELRTAATFWKAESFSAQKKYDEAIPLYSQVARSGDFGAKSQYALGYAYYNKKDYTRALQYFKDFISRGNAEDPSMIGDAVVRIADSYLANKQYNEAMRYYDQAIAQGRVDKEYATYQQARILSFMDRTEEAKAMFDKLQRQYPNSRYSDDALFQAANVDFEKGSYQVAIRGFTRLIQDKPKSDLVPQALLKRAIAYSNLQTYDQAVADYRRILNEYGNSPEAQSALLGLQNALSDAGRAEEFSRELAQYKKANPGSTDVEKVEFENAKSLYFSEKYPQAVQALSGFMQEYPASPSTSEARYYLADSYNRTNDAANALRYYYLIINDRNSDFTVRAASRAAEIELAQRNYARAVRNYQVVLGQARTKNDQVSAMLGLMDTYMAGAKPDSVTYYAREILTAGSVVPGAQNRAQLALGKAALQKGDQKKAQEEFERTIALAKDVNGAEANYLIGDIQYKQKKYKESIATLLKFNEQFGEFEYWKGKAFLLVADNNVGLNEIAQARAVLSSIIENATQPEIVDEARQKLKAIEERN